ncbi:MAG TPA: ROK family transcriptional regulator [Naasia sp.]|jgi:glucokinase
MVDISRGLPAGPTGASDLLQILRDGRPRTRTELAALTGIARSTVAIRVDALMRAGLVEPAADATSTGGRPSAQFALNTAGRYVLGVDVGASHVRVGVSDLSGKLRAEESSALEIAEGPEVVLGWVVDAGLRLLDQCGAAPTDLLAVGVGLPGPVEHSTGRPINPPIMPGWDRFDVPGWLMERLDVPVLVDNDVNIMALGEHGLAWPDTDHLIFVKVATGIGSGVISDGHLQRGAQGIAGDIGHVHVSRGTGIPCRCGNLDCLEALASGPAVATVLRERGLEAASSADVVELVKRGAVEAVQATRQAGRDLGEVLTACVSLMNPSVIVIGGSMARAGEHLIAGVREVVYTRCMPLATQHLQIVQSRAGRNAALLGASMLAIQHALSPERIEAMVASTSAPGELVG